MRRNQRVGTKYDASLDDKLDANQTDLVNTLLTPREPYLGETRGATQRIVCSYPVIQETQPVQARGRIVWNSAYTFQPKGPSYLDGTSK